VRFWSQKNFLAKKTQNKVLKNDRFSKKSLQNFAQKWAKKRAKIRTKFCSIFGLKF